MSELSAARDLMERFVARTAVGSRGHRRYLWTDAFAVCNLLGLARSTGEGRWGELALRLVDDVHHVLGRHRADDVRRGWIGGLSDAEGEARPTCGGLRIGKHLPERAPTEPFDERREWDRDGQYFHYATKWMHALDQTARAFRQPLLNEWGRDLARAAHRGFTYDARGGGRRMYWKVSIDLSRPLVPSMGQHDPLDGFLTCVELDLTRAELAAPGASVGDLAADFGAMVDYGSLATVDPLGIGGLLVDAHRVAQLGRRGMLAGESGLGPALLRAVSLGLAAYAARGEPAGPVSHRLAFRELGLAIGLSALVPEAKQGAALARYAPLRAEIVSFWLRPAHQATDAWRSHEDINEVMLATALQPDGFLTPWRQGD
jgi:hypothetical protein